MGNALGCVGLGERLAAAARDGDAAAARRLLAADPGLARCSGSTFGSLSSPLQIAASKGHHEVCMLLHATKFFVCLSAGRPASVVQYCLP